MIDYEEARKALGEDTIAEIAAGLELPGTTMESKIGLVEDKITGAVAWWLYAGIASSKGSLAACLEEEFEESGAKYLLEKLGGAEAVAAKIWTKLKEESKC